MDFKKDRDKRKYAGYYGRRVKYLLEFHKNLNRQFMSIGVLF